MEKTRKGGGEHDSKRLLSDWCLVSIRVRACFFVWGSIERQFAAQFMRNICAIYAQYVELVLDCERFVHMI